MKMINIRKIFLILLTFFFLGCQNMQNDVYKKPNIIIIYTDDMGIGDASYTGGDIVIPTPNIDQMAKEGKVFTQYYTPAPVCSPSRVGVFTGTYHIRWNINTFLSSVKWNKKTGQSDYLVTKAPNMAKVFKKAGYKTAHYGKWHMGGGRDVKAPTLDQYGFDDFVSTWESPNPDPLLTSSNWIWKPEDSIKRWERTKYFVDHTLEFLKKNPDQPCFINLWPDDVHTPWVPSEQSQENWKEKGFQLPPLKLVMEDYDKEIGRLLRSLKEMEIAENTLVIFTSDNGPAPSFERLRTNGLRGIKNSIYEGGVKMPFIVWWPGTIIGGQKDDKSIIASIDLLPTLASITGADINAQLVDGEDFSSTLIGSTPFNRNKNLYLEYGRNPDFNFPKDFIDKSPHLAVRSGKWKLLTNTDGSQMELYDLATDPNESDDISNQNLEFANDLKKEIINWYNETDRSETDDIRSLHLQNNVNYEEN